MPKPKQPKQSPATPLPPRDLRAEESALLDQLAKWKAVADLAQSAGDRESFVEATETAQKIRRDLATLRQYLPRLYRPGA